MLAAVRKDLLSYDSWVRNALAEPTITSRFDRAKNVPGETEHLFTSLAGPDSGVGRFTVALRGNDARGGPRRNAHVVL